MTVYKASIPEVFGYGLEAYAETYCEAVKLLRMEYYRGRRNSGGFDKTFGAAYDYFGGSVRKLELPVCGAEGDIGVFLGLNGRELK